MSTPTQAHPNKQRIIDALADALVDVDSGALHREYRGGELVEFARYQYSKIEPLLAASRGSDEATDALIGELRETARSRFVSGDDGQLFERAADALAALTGKDK